MTADEKNHFKFFQNIMCCFCKMKLDLFEILGPDLIEPCSNSTMITSPNQLSVILLGCEESPESSYELINSRGNYSWRKMPQKLPYSNQTIVAFLIPDDMVTCKDSATTTTTSTARSISHTDISISESASVNIYVWLSLSGSLLIGLLITGIIYHRKRKTYFLSDEKLSLFWTKNDNYEDNLEDLPNFHKSDVIKAYFIGIYVLF